MSGIVQLYLIKVPEKFIVSNMILDEPQRMRAREFSGKRRSEYTVGRSTLSFALGEEWRIQEQQKLGPRVTHKFTGSERATSISHSNKWVGVALTGPDQAVALGLDIEKVRSGWSERKARFFCNKPQADKGLTLPAGAEQDNYFTTLWTQKEAYFKATQGPFVEMDFQNDERIKTFALDKNFILSVFCDPVLPIQINGLKMNMNGCLSPSDSCISLEKAL